MARVPLSLPFDVPTGGPVDVEVDMTSPIVRSVVNRLLRARAGAVAYTRASKEWPLEMAVARLAGERPAT